MTLSSLEMISIFLYLALFPLDRYFVQSHACYLFGKSYVKSALMTAVPFEMH